MLGLSILRLFVILVLGFGNVPILWCILYNCNFKILICIGVHYMKTSIKQNLERTRKNKNSNYQK